MARAKAKSKTKSAGRKRSTATKQRKTAKVTTARERHRGRRPEPAPKVKDRHEKVLKARIEKLNAAEAKVQEEKNQLAAEIDSASADSCSTTWICEIVGRSRQTVFKLVAERVDGKVLNPSWGKNNGGGKAKTAPAKASKAKPKAAAKAAKPKGRRGRPKGSKNAPKPNGRKADPAGLTKGKAKAKSPLARRPRKFRPRPKATA